jgi:DNA polymerase III delta subunit
MIVGDPVLTEPKARTLAKDLAAGTGAQDDMEIVRGDDGGVKAAVEGLRQVGMFSSGQCVWLRGFAPDADQSRLLLELFEGGLPDDSHLIVTAEKIDRRMSAFRKLADAGAIEDLRIPKDKRGKFDEATLAKFVAARIRESGLKAPKPAVITLLVERAGGELGAFAQEIDRLCLACGNDGTLSADLVRETMPDRAEAWVFDLTEALGSRRPERAERVVEQLLEQGEAPLRLTAALASHLADLVEAKRFQRNLPPKTMNMAMKSFAGGPYKSLPEAARSRFPNPYRAYFAFRAAAAFRAGELRALHRQIVRIDTSLKSSPRKPLHLFSEFVQAACASAA